MLLYSLRYQGSEQGWQTAAVHASIVPDAFPSFSLVFDAIHVVALEFVFGGLCLSRMPTTSQRNARDVPGRAEAPRFGQTARAHSEGGLG